MTLIITQGATFPTEHTILIETLDDDRPFAVAATNPELVFHTYGEAVYDIVRGADKFTNQDLCGTGLTPSRVASLNLLAPDTRSSLMQLKAVFIQ